RVIHHHAFHMSKPRLQRTGYVRKPSVTKTTATWSIYQPATCGRVTRNAAPSRRRAPGLLEVAALAGLDQFIEVLDFVLQAPVIAPVLILQHPARMGLETTR